MRSMCVGVAETGVEHCSPAKNHKETFSFIVLLYDQKYQKSGIVKICAVRNSPKSEIRGKCAGFTEWSVAERRKSSAARRLGGVRGDPLTVLHRRQAAGVY